MILKQPKLADPSMYDPHSGSLGLLYHANDDFGGTHVPTALNDIVSQTVLSKPAPLKR